MLDKANQINNDGLLVPVSTTRIPAGTATVRLRPLNNTQPTSFFQPDKAGSGLYLNMIPRGSYK